jgi:hypothetical protein
MRVIGKTWIVPESNQKSYSQVTSTEITITPFREIIRVISAQAYGGTMTPVEEHRQMTMRQHLTSHLIKAVTWAFPCKD